jgi:hypothetical protein
VATTGDSGESSIYSPPQPASGPPARLRLPRERLATLALRTKPKPLRYTFGSLWNATAAPLEEPKGAVTATTAVMEVIATAARTLARLQPSERLWQLEGYGTWIPSIRPSLEDTQKRETWRVAQAATADTQPLDGCINPVRLSQYTHALGDPPKTPQRTSRVG